MFSVQYVRKEELELITEVMSNLYRLEVPLPNTPLKYLNSYLIKGEERNLLVDTGLNHSKCLEAMRSGLKELSIDLEKTDILLTHFHADHSSLVTSLKTEFSTLYCGKRDSFIFSKDFVESDYWNNIQLHLLQHGFPESLLTPAFDNNPGYTHCSFASMNHTEVNDGDIICVGSYRFRCIETPGHTEGHICLYEPERKLLLAGDHILSKITPNISLVSDNDNPLKDYLQSLDKIYPLDVDLALTGHRDFIKNFRARILELKHHSDMRCTEVIDILKNGTKTGYQIASEIKWAMTYESWEKYPPTQKMYATWETLAHLKFLEEKQVIERVTGKKVEFSLVMRKTSD